MAVENRVNLATSDTGARLSGKLLPLMGGRFRGNQEAVRSRLPPRVAEDCFHTTGW